MQSPTSPVLFVHASLQTAKSGAKRMCPLQSPPKPFMAQLSDMAVSWRASWRRGSPRGLTQMASTLELGLDVVVFVRISPHTSTQLPAASIAICARLYGLPACVPQKPAERQACVSVQRSFSSGSKTYVQP